METILSGLHSTTKYAIEVAAVNSAGIGVFSIPISEQTNGMCIHNTSGFFLHNNYASKDKQNIKTPCVAE